MARRRDHHSSPDPSPAEAQGQRRSGVTSPLSDPTAAADQLLRPWPGREWVALHCKPRAEKIVADHCKVWSIPCYLPTRRSVHRYRRKVATFEVPLFPGYVFCAMDRRADRLRLLRTNRIANVLPVPDEALFLEELRQVYLATHLTDQVEQADFDPTGRKVLLLTGPLAGLTGRVVEKRGQTSLVLNLGFLHQAACVRIDLKTTEIEYLE